MDFKKSEVYILARKSGIRDETQDGFSRRAGEYEAEVSSDRYTGPGRIRTRICEYFPASVRPSVKILDIAAGTGLVGKELREAGFSHVDALEPNAEMVAEAKKRGIYENYYLEFLTEEELNIPKGTYDAITGSGLFGLEDEHMPMVAFYEMIRLVKPGGYICLGTRIEILDAIHYHEMEALMKRIENEGKWLMVGRTIAPNHNLERDGIYWTFKVL